MLSYMWLSEAVAEYAVAEETFNTVTELICGRVKQWLRGTLLSEAVAE